MPEQNYIDDLHHEPLPEGEEKAPPFTRTMSIVRWCLLIALSVFALVMVLTYFGATPWAGDKTGNVMYHCPMHPTYVSSQPGDCPICGMSLVPIDSKIDADSAAKQEHSDTASQAESHAKVSVAKPGQYYCPMDPEVASDTPGKCPICGMNLEKFEPGMKFTCEMHPQIITDHPGDCPICGMDLIPMTSQSQSMERMKHDTSLGESPVSGLVPVTIEPKRLQLINVRTGTVAKRPLDDQSSLIGYITPDESRISNLNVRVSGWVQKLNVNETGQKVSQGQPLLSIYSQDLYQAQQDFVLALNTSKQPNGDSALATTRAQIVDAARERLRLLGLTKDEIARIESSGQVASDITLRSPVNGVVLNKSVLAGQYVNPDQSLYTVADLSHIWVLADAYESDLANINVGQPAIMTVTSFPSETFEGKVTFIYPTVTEQTRTIKVRIEFANPDMKLRPGMYADISLAGNSEPVLAIPREAIMEGGNEDYVFVVHQGGHFEPRKVTTGKSANEWVQVLSGVREGETVLTSANFLIDSESRLKAAVAGMSGATTPSHAEHGK